MNMKKIIIQKGLFLDRFAYIQDGALKKLKFVNKEQKYFEKDIFLSKKKRQNISMKSVKLSLDENTDGFMHYIDEENFDYKLCQIKKIYNNDKNPKLSFEITLVGKYLVYIKGSNGLAISSKAKDDTILKEFENQIDGICPKDVKIILRSNLKKEDISSAINEVVEFNTIYENIDKKAKLTSKPQLLYRQYEQEEMFLSKLNEDIDELYTNDKTISQIIKNSRFNIKDIIFDKNSNLFDINMINSEINKLLSDKVSLKHNINIYIQKTEAMHIIDVNSAGYFKYKNPSQNAYHINSYVIPEIARQISLRDLSGIILIDFIDMKDESLSNKLINQMQNCLDEDDRKASVVSMTKLSLMQIIRKKEDMSLSENLLGDKGVDIYSEDYIFEQISEKLVNLKSDKKDVKIYLPIFESPSSYKKIRFLEQQYNIKIQESYLKKENFKIKIEV